MADADDRIVVVGAGIAGDRAVENLRSLGFDGAITLVGEESDRPYDRTPLSKAVLLGDEPPESVFQHDPEWYDQQRIDLRLGVSAEAVDPQAHEVRLSDGSALPYTKLLLTTGSRLRRLDVPGDDLDGVHYLRRLGDSRSLLARFRAGGRVVVVGGGWIGLETAAAARRHGCEVTLVEPQPTPLFGVVGRELGGFFADLHSANGVTLRLEEGVAEFRGDGGALTAVVTSTGEELPADAAVVGVGILPNVELAAAAGLEVDNGVVCDQTLRTSDPDVYAAGDVASWDHPVLGHRLRVEHWANAHDGGQAAARSLLSPDAVYDVLPFFWSDQYDIGLEYAGHVPRGADTELVLRGEPASKEFMAFWLDGDRMLAGMHVNVWDTMDAVQQLIRDRTPLDRGRLADSTVTLDQVGRTTGTT